MWPVLRLPLFWMVLMLYGYAHAVVTNILCFVFFLNNTSKIAWVFWTRRKLVSNRLLQLFHWMLLTVLFLLMINSAINNDLVQMTMCFNASITALILCVLCKCYCVKISLLLIQMWVWYQNLSFMLQLKMWSRTLH